MRSGRLPAIAIIAITLLFAAGLWYANTRAYYAPLDVVEITLENAHGDLMGLDVTDAQGIDADTSPLRYRACFLTEGAISTDTVIYIDPTPLTTPAWFDCFDAAAIGAALEAGEAQAYLGQHEVHRGVDRVVAIFPDGRGVAWQQLNGTLE